MDLIKQRPHKYVVAVVSVRVCISVNTLRHMRSSKLYEKRSRVKPSMSCSCVYNTVVQGSPLRRCSCEIPGVSQVERGETGVHVSYIEPILVQYVRFAGAGPLLLLLLHRSCCTMRVLHKINGGVGWNHPGCCVQDGARPHNTHTRIHTEAPFAAVIKRRP